MSDLDSQSQVNDDAYLIGLPRYGLVTVPSLNTAAASFM